MADKLSERLDDAWRKLYADGDEHDVCDTIAEAAELARRFEGAPTVQITECNQIEGAKDFDYGDMVAASQKFDAGQRVRIVPDSPTPPDPTTQEVPDA